MNTWKIYKDSKILPYENYIVDNIDSYLSTLINETIEKGQYIKHALNLGIKINKNQASLIFSRSSHNYNYMEIQNDDDYYPVYYFIIRKEWISENTIMLILKMDVLNTFTTERFSFHWSDRTMVIREHKNRFKKVGDDYLANIDLYSEGINPQLYIKNRYKLTDSSTLPLLDWYLIYMNQNEPTESLTNPVNCYLCASSNINILPIGGTEQGIIRYNDIPQGTYYFLSPDDNNVDITITAGEESYTMNRQGSGDTKKYAMIQSNNNKLYVYIYQKLSSSINPSIQKEFEVPFISLNPTTPLSFRYNDNIPQYFDDIFNYPSITISYTSFVVLGIDSIDRTNSKIIKILKLPYCPTDVSMSGNLFNFNSSIWEFDGTYSLLKLKNIQGNSLQFKREMDFFTSFLAPVGNTYNGTKDRTALKSMNYEMKLYHSDFYNIKYIYDTFSYLLKLEQVTPFNGFVKDTYKISFIHTKTLNSRFLFSIGLDLDYSIEDYPCFINVARNNEETIYNSPYINYIRAGYNYDVKSKNRTEAFSWFSTALGIVGGAFSVAFGSKTLGVALISSSIASIGNAINTTISAEQNFNAKINQLQWQTASVHGSDDIDLLSEYNKNKLWMHIYEPSPKMKELLFDMFYYTGYIANVQKVPDFTSRYWFNFVACEPIFDGIVSIPDECVEELKQRFRGGVTNLHAHLIDSTMTWDFARIYENWETMFFN